MPAARRRLASVGSMPGSISILSGERKRASYPSSTCTTPRGRPSLDAIRATSLERAETERNVEAQLVHTLLDPFDGLDPGPRPRRRRQADEHLVDRLPLDLGRLAPEQLVDVERGREVGVERAVEEDAVGTAEGGLRERHARRGCRTCALRVTPRPPSRGRPAVRRSRPGARLDRVGGAARRRRRTSRGRGGQTWHYFIKSSVDRPLDVPRGARRLGEDPHVLLQRGNQVRHDLQRQRRSWRAPAP